MQVKQTLKMCPVYASLLVSYMMSCNRISNDRVVDFIPGVYERRINNEYSKGSDQLIVTQQQGNVYTIEKRSAIVRIQDGVKLPVKYDTAIWTGIYDSKDQVIYEQRKGKVISFKPKENKLLVGASVYRKVR
ncbi:MAG TPA: hypothetical protein PKE30_18395 [Niabella sp.]|nr:hypothetical protein [Niabella sp.]